MFLSSRIGAMQMILAQLLATLSISLLLSPFGGHLALSALLGGGIATLTSWLVASKVFVPYRAQQPGQVLTRFYSAEIQKILLTALLFGLVAVFVAPLNPIALFGVYLAAQMVPYLYAYLFIE